MSPRSLTGSETMQGVIRGLISRSRQDINKIDNEVVMRRGTLDYSGSSASETSNLFSVARPRPKSEFYPPQRNEYDSSSTTDGRRLYRPKSMEFTSTDVRRADEECDIIPLEREDSLPSISTKI